MSIFTYIFVKIYDYVYIKRGPIPNEDFRLYLNLYLCLYMFYTTLIILRINIIIIVRKLELLHYKDLLLEVLSNSV